MEKKECVQSLNLKCKKRKIYGVKATQSIGMRVHVFSDKENKLNNFKVVISVQFIKTHRYFENGLHVY